MMSENYVNGLYRTACVCVSAILIAVSLGHARAEEFDQSVQGLYNNCKSQASIGVGFCLGYLGGIGHGLIAVGEVAGVAASQYDASNAVESAFLRMGICGQATFGAYQQAFINWAERHPESWSMDMTVGAILALRETWPCSKS